MTCRHGNELLECHDCAADQEWRESGDRNRFASAIPPRSAAIVAKCMGPREPGDGMAGVPRGYVMRERLEAIRLERCPACGAALVRPFRLDNGMPMVGIVVLEHSA